MSDQKSSKSVSPSNEHGKINSNQQHTRTSSTPGIKDSFFIFRKN